MKLFAIPGACSTADHIALQWTGGPFEVEVLTPEKLRSPDYLRLNPAGSVPALFERADAQLERRDWLAGFRSVADAYLFVMLRWAAAFQVDLEGLANLALFRRRMQQDAGVRAALGAEGLA